MAVSQVSFTPDWIENARTRLGELAKREPPRVQKQRLSAQEAIAALAEEIRAALAIGWTLERIVAELNTDEHPLKLATVRTALQRQRKREEEAEKAKSTASKAHEPEMVAKPPHRPRPKKATHVIGPASARTKPAEAGSRTEAVRGAITDVD
jgi:hypothetical protein